MTTAPSSTGVADHEEQHRLTAVQGLAALSLDALSSVAYGPEAILVVLVAAGATALHYSVPITGAIVVLLAVLVVSYRQVIAAFPNGGGAYAVSKAHLGTQASLVAAASLIVDYVLNAAVGVSAGIEALYLHVPRALWRQGLAVPGRARPHHRPEPVGRFGVCEGLHGPDAAVHPVDGGSDHRRPDPYQPRGARSTIKSARPPRRSASCCC